MCQGLKSFKPYWDKAAACLGGQRGRNEEDWGPLRPSTHCVLRPRPACCCRWRRLWVPGFRSGVGNGKENIELIY